MATCSLLVHGYIRGIAGKKYTPMSIHEECLRFLKVSQTIFVSIFDDIAGDENKTLRFGILDVENRKCKMIMTNKALSEDEHLPSNKAFCYIPAASTKLNRIVTCFEDGESNITPTLFVYESSTAICIKSKQKLSCSPRQFLPIGGDSFLYEYNGKFFEHKWNESEYANFVEIKQKDQCFEYENSAKSQPKWLQMTYIPDNHSIFAVMNKDFARKGKRAKAQNVNYENQAGIFNLNAKKWESVQPLSGERKMLRNGPFGSVTCYQNGCIFTANTYKHTAQYDLEKKVWSDILKNDTFYADNNAVLWLEDYHILSCLNRSAVKQYADKKLLEWTFVDLRDPKQGCLVRSEFMEGFPLEVAGTVFV